MKELENIIDLKFDGISSSLKEILEGVNDINVLLEETDRHLGNIDKSLDNINNSFDEYEKMLDDNFKSLNNSLDELIRYVA